MANGGAETLPEFTDITAKFAALSLSSSCAHLPKVHLLPVSIQLFSVDDFFVFLLKSQFRATKAVLFS